MDFAGAGLRAGLADFAPLGRCREVMDFDWVGLRGGLADFAPLGR